MNQVLCGILMVVATLIAPFAYQVGTTPPGGNWQVDPIGAPMPAGPQPGIATVSSAKISEAMYMTLVYSTVAYSICLTILLFVLPFHNTGYTIQFFIILMQIAVFCSVGIYGESIERIYNLLPGKYRTIIKSYNVYWDVVVGVWCLIRLFQFGVWLRHLLHVPPPPSLEMIALEDVHVQTENEIH